MVETAGTELTVKEALVAPAAMVTLAGTVATALFDRRAIDTPPAGATALRVTVPVELAPPTTVVGLRATLDTTSGLTVSVADTTALKLAETVTDFVEDTGIEVTVNVADRAPDATVTDAGTVAELVSLLDKVTTVPPAGAIPLRVTVPVELVLPPTAVDGDNATV